ncbi:MAG TPA: thermonuclease family protein, partial [Pirellulales bacterium]
MIRLIALLILLLPVPAVAEEFTGKVVAITDGDTIKVLRDREEIKIRLEGIDCPESHQAFGNKAKQATSDLAFGEIVTVQAKGKDRYGRVLADIILPDGKNLSRELVRSGFAWWYRKYSKDETLGKLEAEARDAKRGLWADPNPIPPWDWRHGQRMAPATDAPPAKIEPNGVEIVALLPNPVGRDRGHEEVTLANSTAQEIRLHGWKLQDRAGNEFRLSGSIPAKGKLPITMTDPSMPLNNDGDDVFLIDANGTVRSK